MGTKVPKTVPHFCSPVKTKKALTRLAGRAFSTHERAPLSAGRSAQEANKCKGGSKANQFKHHDGQEFATCTKICKCFSKKLFRSTTSRRNAKRFLGQNLRTSISELLIIKSININNIDIIRIFDNIS